MNTKIIKALMKGIVAILVAIIGIFAGIKIEQKSTQTRINKVMGDVINVNGNDNDITINNIENFMQTYLQLQSDYKSLNQQKDSLVEQNTKYLNELDKANSLIDELKVGYDQEIHNLKAQLSSVPIIEYRSLALSIDMEDVPVNSNDSMVTIDGRDYFSREIVENLISDNKDMTIKENKLNIGKIILEQSDLNTQWVVDSYNVYDDELYTDSFGNSYSNSLLCTHNSSYIIYTLNQKYMYLKFQYSASEQCDLNGTGTIIIKADNKIVYTSSEIKKLNAVQSAVDVPINNCTLLSIEYSNTTNDWFPCIVSDAVVYN